MAPEGFMWECECGQIEYGKNPPEECSKCSGISTYERVPEELIAEKEEEHILSQKFEEEEDED